MISVILLLPFVLACFYLHPGGDDFNYACRSASENLANNLEADYFHWNGRYASNVLIFNNPIHLGGLVLYRLAPILLLLLTFLGMNWSIKSLLKKINRQTRWVISLLFVVIFLGTMPILSEGFYWYTGAYTYHLSCLLTIIYGTWLVRYLNRQFIMGRQLDLIALSLLVFIICGCCEVTTLILFWSHLIVFYFLIKQKNYGWFLPILVSCIVGFLLMTLAPGNEERAAYFSDKYDFLHSLKMTVLQTGRFLLTWLINPAFVIGLLAVPVFYQSFRTSLLEKIRFSNAFGLVILLFIMFSCIFPAYWGTGILGQHRTLNVAYFFTIIWTIVWMISAVNQGKVRYERLAIPPFRKWLFSVLLISVVVAPNYYRLCIEEISGIMFAYNEDMQMRYQLIRTCPNDCPLPEVSAKPKSIFLYDISDDHKHFVNEGWACFYGKNTVYLKK